VQTYDAKPKRRLFEVLSAQGMAPNQQVAHRGIHRVVGELDTSYLTTLRAKGVDRVQDR